MSHSTIISTAYRSIVLLDGWLKRWIQVPEEGFTDDRIGQIHQRIATFWQEAPFAEQTAIRSWVLAGETAVAAGALAAVGVLPWQVALIAPLPTQRALRWFGIGVMRVQKGRIMQEVVCIGKVVSENFRPPLTREKYLRVCKAQSQFNALIKRVEEGPCNQPETRDDLPLVQRSEFVALTANLERWLSDARPQLLDRHPH